MEGIFPFKNEFCNTNLFNFNKMMYLGFPIEYEECVRMLKIPKSTPINEYLLEKNSALQLKWIDKNLYVLGIPMSSPQEYVTCDTMISYILNLKYEFNIALEKLNVDRSSVEIAYMEDIPVTVKYPEPYVLHF